MQQDEELSPGLGWAPALSVVTAMGLLVSAAAAVISRNDTGPVASTPANIAFWVGILLVTIPAGIRLLSVHASGTERLLLVTFVGLGLYLIKLLHDPVMFTLFDEFFHVRSVDDILITGRLFVPSPLLPVSPSFPGLETITAVTVAMSGSSVYLAGAVMLGIGRVLLVLALFLFYLRIGRSARIAGVAAFIYMANPNFLFFQAQFAYESLAVPFAVLALYAVARYVDGADPRLRSWLIVGTAIAATVITHHVTSFALFAFLTLWCVAAFLVERRIRKTTAPVMPAVLTGVLSYVWLVAVAGIVVGYLAPAVAAATQQVVRVLQGDKARELFSASAAPRSPFWEQGLAYFGIAVLLALTGLGLWVIWRRGHVTPAIAALAIASLGYPASLAARFTAQGAELSDRAGAFVFLALGFVIAAGLEWHKDVALLPDGRPRLSSLTSRVGTRMSGWGLPWKAAALVIIMMSGIALSFPVWARLPGPYLVSADPRSVEPEGITTAEWAANHLPRDSRFLVDRVNRVLLGSIGGQHPVTASFDQVRVRNAFFSLTLGPQEVKVMAEGAIDYVLIDRRLSSSLPIVGVYYERGEISSGSHRSPIPAQALEKFDGVDNVSRIFDSGDVQVYDVRALTE